MAVSELACWRVLNAIATERIESKTMTVQAISRRSTYSMSYTRSIMSELVRRGWINVAPGKKLSKKEVTLTKEGLDRLLAGVRDNR